MGHPSHAGLISSIQGHLSISKGKVTDSTASKDRHLWAPLTCDMLSQEGCGPGVRHTELLEAELIAGQRRERDVGVQLVVPAFSSEAPRATVIHACSRHGTNV
jgi:hypothetical protein